MRLLSRGVISTFSWGGQIFLYFSMPLDYWKIGKKQHFICSNLTLFIVPFFLSFFFLLFFSFFFFFFFFLFSFSLGGGWWRPPQPSSNDAPALVIDLSFHEDVTLLTPIIWSLQALPEFKRQRQGPRENNRTTAQATCDIVDGAPCHDQLQFPTPQRHQ